MTPLLVTADQRDALVELVNIGMGQAGDRLARLLDVFVQLSVPHVRTVDPGSLITVVRTIVDSTRPVVATRQAFSSDIRGEAIVVFDSAGCVALDELVGPGGGDEMVLDISNQLISTCVAGIARQIGHELAFSAPSILGRGDQLDEALVFPRIDWGVALIADVSFRIEGQPFCAYLLMFWPDDAITALGRAIDQMLARLI